MLIWQAISKHLTLVTKDCEFSAYEWCIPEVSAEYVAAMEEVLDLYEAPYDPARPVVCFDESPIDPGQRTVIQIGYRPSISFPVSIRVRTVMEHAYTHHIPSRIRVRCASLKRNPQAITLVKTALDGLVRCGLLRGQPAYRQRHRSLCPRPDRWPGHHASPEGPGPLRPRGDHPSTGDSNAWALRPAGSHDTPEMAPPFPPISLATLGTFLGVAGVALGKVVVGKLVEKAVERSAMALIGAIL